MPRQLTPCFLSCLPLFGPPVRSSAAAAMTTLGLSRPVDLQHAHAIARSCTSCKHLNANVYHRRAPGPLISIPPPPAQARGAGVSERLRALPRTVRRRLYCMSGEEFAASGNVGFREQRARKNSRETDERRMRCFTPWARHMRNQEVSMQVCAPGSVGFDGFRTLMRGGAICSHTSNDPLRERGSPPSLHTH